MAEKETDTQTIDLTPLMTPISILIGAVMISVSIFFGVRGADFAAIEDKKADTTTVSNNGSSVSAGTVSSGQVAGETDTSSPVEIVEVSYAGAPQKGSDGAKVVLLEFTDFECPYCARHFTETQGSIEANYVDKGEVKYITRDYPLPIHPDAQKAAEASHCAADQGKYWEMHDIMFTNQTSIAVNDLKDYAEELGLNSSQFSDCLDSGKYESEVEQSLADGSSAGVSGTPGFIIGEDIGDGKVRGFLIPGAYPYSTFQQIIDEIKANGLESAADKCSMTADGRLLCSI